MRSVDTARSFLAFIASVKALLMSSRSTGNPLFLRYFCLGAQPSGPLPRRL